MRRAAGEQTDKEEAESLFLFRPQDRRPLSRYLPRRLNPLCGLGDAPQEGGERQGSGWTKRRRNFYFYFGRKTAIEISAEPPESALRSLRRVLGRWACRVVA